MTDVDVPARMRVPLAFLEANGGEIEGKTRFQKLVFLAEEEYGLNTEYEFEKYHYGPYSFELSDDFKALERMGFIQVNKEVLGEDAEQYVYVLTEKGKKVAEDISSSLLNPIQSVIHDWEGGISLQELLDYVYDNYM